MGISAFETFVLETLAPLCSTKKPIFLFFIIPYPLALLLILPECHSVTGAPLSWQNTSVFRCCSTCFLKLLFLSHSPFCICCLDLLCSLSAGLVLSPKTRVREEAGLLEAARSFAWMSKNIWKKVLPYRKKILIGRDADKEQLYLFLLWL